MPFKTFALLILAVTAAAGLTVAAATAFVPALGVGVLAVMAMVVSLILRKRNG